MTLTDDLRAVVNARFGINWTLRDGRIVPQPENLLITGNELVHVRAAVLYTDLVGSTALVKTYYNWFTAHMYKSFLYCAARIIRSEGGVITAYDGDRVMALYRGAGMENAAVRTALKIRFAVKDIINPLQQTRWWATNPMFEMREVTGIDVSDVYVARVGVRDDNDLAWMGRAANIAAKLSALRLGQYCTWITEDRTAR
jgi:class 3 adenylate cyclase